MTIIQRNQVWSLEGAPMHAVHPTSHTQPQKHFITTFYHFFKIEDPAKLKLLIESKGVDLGIRGLIIMGPEGLNSTISCGGDLAQADQSARKLELFKNFLLSIPGAEINNFKNSEADKAPFRRLMIKIRDEIVTLGTPELVPPQGINHHLSPTEWNKVMKEERDFVIIDTRNWYETKIGTFKGAINPMTDKFTEFPEFMEKQKISKDKKLLIFCTGGIRCEKGILELQRQGYNNTFQLQGGILNYLKEYPEDQFEGECFVFDHRVAVDQHMNATTKYSLCPHCGQPAATQIECARCDTETLICEDCATQPIIQKTCTKNCAHHWSLHPDRKGPRQALPFEVER